MRVARTSTAIQDRELLTRVATGDRSALNELYLGYHPRLRRFLSLCLQQDSIDEVINDTFMVVWRNANDFRWASAVSSWIFGIAQRTALKAIRRQKKHSVAGSFDECQEQTVDPALETEVQDWVMHGLNRLPYEQRLTLELACHMGHSVLEIAKMTGAPVGTVKARMFHARLKLRQHLPTLGGASSELSTREH